MKIIEQTNKNLESILMKAFSDTGTFQKPNSLETISQQMMNIKKEETKEDEIIRKKIKKSDITNILSNKKMKLNKPITKVFTTTKEQILEKWSQKYKNSIDCNNPKGFSQKTHCQGKKKNLKETEVLKGGKADKMTIEDVFKKHQKKYKNLTIDILKKQLSKGIKTELEHTNNRNKAKEIAMDHLLENPKYYDKLKKIESNEATGSGAAGGFSPPMGFKQTNTKGEFKEATSSASSGSYETPAAWAKSTSKKDWRGKSKTQIPGGQFVQVKSKCKKFPYCNQGDIKALKLTNEDKINKIISELSKKHNISETLIKKMIYTEFRNKK